MNRMMQRLAELEQIILPKGRVISIHDDGSEDMWALGRLAGGVGMNPDLLVEDETESGSEKQPAEDTIKGHSEAVAIEQEEQAARSKARRSSSGWSQAALPCQPTPPRSARLRTDRPSCPASHPVDRHW